jgi:hypothetical protein
LLPQVDVALKPYSTRLFLFYFLSTRCSNATDSLVKRLGKHILSPVTNNIQYLHDTYMLFSCYFPAIDSHKKNPLGGLNAYRFYCLTLRHLYLGVTYLAVVLNVFVCPAISAAAVLRFIFISASLGTNSGRILCTGFCSTPAGFQSTLKSPIRKLSGSTMVPFLVPNTRFSFFHSFPFLSF